jgi:glycerol-3-phosphate acyltransferase PlsX
MRIALDAMGGDHAPACVVDGALQALAALNDVDIVLFGDERRVRDELARRGADLPVIHTSDVIGMDESPVDALRRKKDSSIVRLAEAAAAGEVDAVISAGHTGAFVAACQLRMRTLPAVSRAGIAVIIPAFNGPFVMIDVGANIQPKPQHLHQYAIMGQEYARHVAGLARQRVGLLSIGEENIKGTEVIRQAHGLIESDPDIEFVGNIEGRHLFEGVCEVAVSDGFVGNIILKLFEGFSRGIFETVAHEIARAKPELQMHFEDVVQRVWTRHDYKEFGGAPVLGVNGVAMICHGNSDAVALRNAIRTTRTYLQRDFNARLSRRLGQNG